MANINTHAHTTLILYKWEIEPTTFRDGDQGKGAAPLGQMPRGHRVIDSILKLIIQTLI
jgi:hypothetical protein